MKIHMRKIKSLKEAAYNPRKITPEQYAEIKESLITFDFAVPIVVNQHPDRKNIIIGGHQRTKVAKDMGIEEVPCVYVNLEEKEERQLNIRLNKNTADWDFAKLDTEFEMDDLTDWGFDEFDFKPKEGKDSDEGLVDVTFKAGGKKTHTCPKCNYEF